MDGKRALAGMRGWRSWGIVDERWGWCGIRGRAWGHSGDRGTGDVHGWRGMSVVVDGEEADSMGERVPAYEVTEVPD